MPGAFTLDRELAFSENVPELDGPVATRGDDLAVSTEKATESTSFLWSTKRRAVLPVAKSQRRKVPSHEPVRAKWPSDEMTTSWTKWEWPRRALRGNP